ncbi:MAG TPA: DUF3418 domain-containing protein, partial [Opitutaceae bacterium]
MLEELGALSEDGPLSEIGRDLARLPVDPTVGRMILQARREKALREVLVIAAGLSVQDPRERPLDKQAQADAAHRRFSHPDSDFVSLLNIWEAYHGEFEQMTQAKLRRFCREHFLSYTRMREWRDVHAQLGEVLRGRRDFRMTSVHDARRTTATDDDAKLLFVSPAYRAIHRSILAGLLGNIATWDEANPGFKATHDRRVALFPGSVLFRRTASTKTGATKPRPAGDGAKVPARWLMAAEIMETSRLYARTCAKIDPAWAVDLGAHVARIAHSEPFWDEKAGRVKVKQRTRLYGLEIENRAVSFGKIDPAGATEIFIREGLVNDTITWPFDFLLHNRALRESIVERLTRARHSGYLNLDEMTYRYYTAQLSLAEVGPAGVSSVAELVDLVRERRTRQPHFLFLEEGDLFDPNEALVDESSFPPSVPLTNSALPLHYAYRPGKEDDGVTVDVSLEEARKLSPMALDWAVPGHLSEKVEFYLRALPKELRRGFVPLSESAAKLTEAVAARHRLTGGRETVAEALAAEIRERHRLGVTDKIWSGKAPPDHLRVRVRVRNDAGVEIVASRDWHEIAAAMGPTAEAGRAGREAANQGHAARGLEAELRYEFAWLERDLKKIRELGPLTATLAPAESLQADALQLFKNWVVSLPGASPDSAAAIKASSEAAKVKLRKEVPRFLAVLREVLDLRSQLLVFKDGHAGLEKDVNALIGPQFLRTTPMDRFWQLPRYLRAMKLRAGRWKKNPLKDA